MKPVDLDNFDRPEPDIEEVRYIILQVIGQAIKDYENYRYKEGEEDRFIFLTAQHFLFNNEYTVEWGDNNLNLREMCEITSLDIDWLRNKITSRLDVKFLPTDGVVVPKRRH